MLGKSLATPMLIFESAACCSISSSEFSSSTATSAVVTKRRSSLVRLNVGKNMIRERIGSSLYASKKWKLHSVDQAQPVVLKDEEKETWEECKQTISKLNFTIEEAEIMLRKAFGWVNSPYWGEERKKEVPKTESITETLGYIRSLGLSDEDLYKLLKKFPEVLGCNLDDEVKTNIGTLEKEWGIEGKALRNLLLRNPKVLGYNVDCKGDCMAKCTRCWVRF